MQPMGEFNSDDHDIYYCGTELHKPMYFFLGNLSCLEMCYVSVTMPSLLAGLWT